MTGAQNAGPSVPPMANGGLQALLKALHQPGSVGPASLASMRELHSRVMARRQLDLSLAQPLQHAGPLHSARLAQQALLRLKQIAPAYLQRMLIYVDTLRALEDAQALVQRSTPAPAVKSRRSKKTAL